jgi:hypothetical protein
VQSEASTLNLNIKGWHGIFAMSAFIKKSNSIIFFAYTDPAVV